MGAFQSLLQHFSVYLSHLFSFMGFNQKPICCVGGFFEYCLYLERKSITLSYPLPSIASRAQQQAVYLDLAVIHSVL